MKILGIILMVFLILFVSPFQFRGSDFDRNVGEIISDYEFNYIRWQVDLLKEFFRTSEEETVLTPEEEALIVWTYFQGEHDNKRLAEIIIARQIEEVLTEKGLTLLPRVNFSIRPLPGYLIMSPREEISRLKEVHVLPGLTYEKREEIEAWLDGLGFSSYISDIAGTTTFPIVVREGAPLRSTIRTVAHEWAHQHLFFRPLGFRYALHFIGWPDDAMAAVNEAVATIVEKEVEEIIYNRYYLPLEIDMPPASPPVLDLRGQLRMVREDVDQFLVLGEIEQAERHMEEQRLYINSYGYNFRKLNQAYFAFHGTYPAISVNPLTRKVHEMRNDSPSLKAFIDEIGRVWDAQELLNNP